MSNNALFILCVQGILAMAVVYAISTSLGVAAEVTGNAIFILSGLRNYTTTQKAASIGFRGGSTGFIIGMACCIAIIAYSRIARQFPILTVPFLSMAGALTGIVGFQSYVKATRMNNPAGEGFTSYHAVRAGALGGAVVGAGLLLVAQACYWAWRLVSKAAAIDGSREAKIPEASVV